MDLRSIAADLARGEIDWSAFRDEATGKRFAVLGKAYLAEHPADEDVLITREWLETIGFTESTRKPGWYDLGGLDFYWTLTYQNLVIRIYNWPLEHIKTRGDVRRLCELLKIKLENRNELSR